MKKKNKALLSIVILSLVTICIISVSFAWFQYNQKVRFSSNPNLEIGVSAGLEMSYYNEDESSWSNYQYGANLPSYNLVDVTSNGKDFSYPYNLDLDDQPIFSMLEISSDEKNGYFLEYYVKLRTSNKLNVYLSKNSYVKPHGSTSSTVFDTTNLSTYGGSGDTAFSSNNIAGAARVSIGEVTRDEDGKISNEQTKQIWIPNPKYHLWFVSGYREAIDDAGNTYNEYYNEGRFDLNGTRESSYGYLENVFTDPNDDTQGYIKTNTYTTKDYLSKYITVGTTRSDSNNTSASIDMLADPDSGLSNDASCLCSFDGNGILQEKELVIRIWIEGTDRESVAALNKGVIDYNIEFCGIAKENEEESDIAKLESIYGKDQDGKLYFKDSNGSYTEVKSSDKIQYTYNGIDWYDYSTGLISYYNEPLNAVASGADRVFIRNKEKKSTCNDSLRLLTLKDYYLNLPVDFTNNITQSQEDINYLHSIVVKDEDGLLYSITGDTETAITSADNIEYSYDGITWVDYDETIGLHSNNVTNSENQTSESEEQTSESEEQTSESEEQTSESEDQTSESEEQTSESEDQTSESEEQTSESEEQTSESEEQTSESEEQTAEFVYIRIKNTINYNYTTVCKLSLQGSCINTIIYKNGGN